MCRWLLLCRCCRATALSSSPGFGRIRSRAGLALRARIVLLAGDGFGTAEIVRRVGVSKPTVIAWKRRYATEGLGGLSDRPKAGKPRTTDDVAIVLRTLEPPPARLGVTHWSSRLLARGLGLSNVKVADVWREYGLQPWRSQTFKLSTDPELRSPSAACASRLPSLSALPAARGG